MFRQSSSRTARHCHPLAITVDESTFCVQDRRSGTTTVGLRHRGIGSPELSPSYRVPPITVSRIRMSLFFTELTVKGFSAPLPHHLGLKSGSTTSSLLH